MSGDGFDPGAFNAFEAAAWEARADAYHGFFAPITTRVIPALLDLAGAGPGCRLLDVATGPGYAAAAAVARGAEVIGSTSPPRWCRWPGGCIPTSSSARATPSSCPSATGPSTR